MHLLSHWVIKKHVVINISGCDHCDTISLFGFRESFSHVVQSPPLTLICRALLWCYEITSGIINSLAKLLPHTMQHGLIDMECMHSLSHCLVQKEQPTSIQWSTSNCVHHMWYDIYLWSMNEKLHYDITKHLQECLSHVVLWLLFSHTGSHCMI